MKSDIQADLDSNDDQVRLSMGFSRAICRDNKGLRKTKTKFAGYAIGKQGFRGRQRALGSQAVALSDGLRKNGRQGRGLEQSDSGSERPVSSPTHQSTQRPANSALYSTVLAQALKDDATLIKEANQPTTSQQPERVCSPRIPVR